MLRFIASSVGVLICASFLYLEKPQNTSALHKPGSGVKVAIPQIEPRPEDVSTIDGMVRAYYEVVSGPADKQREWGRDRTLYIPGIRFLIFREDKDGRTSVRTLTHQQFVEESEAAMAGKAFYEREVHRIAHRAGDVVHVLSTAEQKYSPDGPVEGRSIDSLEMYWDGWRWWITSANIWEVETKAHPLPTEFLP
jgi:hypothetical protein